METQVKIKDKTRLTGYKTKHAYCKINAKQDIVSGSPQDYLCVFCDLNVENNYRF